MKRLHPPQSNFDTEINNDLIQMLEDCKQKLSNPNTKLRWGVDLNRVIKQRFSNLKKEGDSYARCDRSTYCDTVNNTLDKSNKKAGHNLDIFQKNLEIFSKSSQSNIQHINDDLFSLCSRNSNIFEAMSQHSHVDGCKPSSIESPARYFNTDCKLYRKKIKCDNLSEDGNYDHNSLKSSDHRSKSRNSLERLIFLSRSSDSNFSKYLYLDNPRP